jgi:hypothetical protein
MFAELRSGALIAALIGGSDEDLLGFALEMPVGFDDNHIAHPARQALGERTPHQRGW